MLIILFRLELYFYPLYNPIFFDKLRILLVRERKFIVFENVAE